MAGTKISAERKIINSIILLFWLDNNVDSVKGFEGAKIGELRKDSHVRANPFKQGKFCANGLHLAK
jgi:hypothetical protein